MNRSLFFILVISLLIINVNSVPKLLIDNYLNRHVWPLPVRQEPGRWFPEETKADPEPKVETYYEVEKNSFGQKLVCYVGTWANYRHGEGRFIMEDIDPFLCTHIIYGFAKLENNKITPFDDWLDYGDEWGLKGYERFNNLKKLNPALKTIIAIGGWNEGSEKYGDMAKNPAFRKIFVDSVVEFLGQHNFDGFDFDWEYPANRGGQPEDKENFVKCLEELRAAFGSKYLLTAAVSAGRSTIDLAYDIPAMNRLCDFINLMGYDFHGAWHDYTGHNAPLFVKHDEPEDEKTMNIDYAVDHWIGAGANPSKITLGMPVYGRTFTLLNTAKYGLYANTSGPGRAGPFTNEGGMIGYNELCQMTQRESGLWNRYYDDEYRAPYMVKGDQWIGFDDVESIEIKTRYAKAKNLGGAMIWSLDTDDFRGICGQGKYPITSQIKRTLATGTALQLPPKPSSTNAPPKPTNGPPNPTNPSPNPPTNAPPVPTSGPNPGSEFICRGSGFFGHNKNCAKYYECVANTQRQGVYEKFERECAPGTHFSPKISVCNIATLVDDCVAQVAKPDNEHKQIVNNKIKCEQSGIFVNENDCKSFINCREIPSNGGHQYIAEEQYCPDGLVFDDKIKTCNKRELVERCNNV